MSATSDFEPDNDEIDDYGELTFDVDDLDVDSVDDPDFDRSTNKDPDVAGLSCRDPSPPESRNTLGTARHRDGFVLFITGWVSLEMKRNGKVVSKAYLPLALCWEFRPTCA